MYTEPPIVWNHELVIGDTYAVAPRTLLVDGEVVDLEDAEGEMQVRTEPGGLLLATGVVTIDETDDELSWSIDAATTAALQPTPKAEYSVRLTFGDGTVRTVYEGRLAIRPAVVG